MHGLDIHPEDIRQILERYFQLPFGQPLDVAELVEPVVDLDDSSPSQIKPPLALREGFSPRLVEHQWRRLIQVVREPVAEWRGFSNVRAAQILGQTVLLFMPDGTLYSWVWIVSRKYGAQLVRMPGDQVAIPGWSARDGWLMRLEEMATDEYRCYGRTSLVRAPAMARWQFNVFRQVLARHADLAWMRVRMFHSLGLSKGAMHQAESCKESTSDVGALTVAQYNAAWISLGGTDRGNLK